MKNKVFKRLDYFIAFGFGSGLSPVAPGTMGTLVAAVLYLGLHHFPTWMYTLFIIMGFFVGLRVSESVSRDLKAHDYPGIVIDECVGFWITLWLMPFSYVWMMLGFLLFRFFDILKPWPIRQIDKQVKGGLGIMLDDVVAGVFACIVLHVIRIFI